MARHIDPCQLGFWGPAPTRLGDPMPLVTPGADVRFYPGFMTGDEAAGLFARLRAIAPWRQDRRRMYERVLDVPRLSSWYGTQRPWPEPLREARDRIEAATGYRYDGVLLNLYRDGRDSVAWHRDDVDRFGQDEIIASLSLGATRRFLLRPRPGQPGEALAIDLPAGSLLLMGPGTQTNWEHCVPKTARPVGERLNLTFRRSAALAAAI